MPMCRLTSRTTPGPGSTPSSYAALVFTIVTINAWNRLAITSHSPAGTHRPKQVTAS